MIPPEVIYDIEEPVAAFAKHVSADLIKDPNQYLGVWLKRLETLSGIDPLKFQIIAPAYEARGETKFRLLGSFFSLDLIGRDHYQKGLDLEVTRLDVDRFRKFTNDFLVDERWRDPSLMDGRVIKDFERYKQLLEETGGPVADISILTKLMEVKGRNRLLNTVKDTAQQLGDGLSEVIEEMFMRGAYPVIGIFTVKYGSIELERLLLEQKLDSNPN